MIIDGILSAGGMNLRFYGNEDNLMATLEKWSDFTLLARMNGIWEQVCDSLEEQVYYPDGTSFDRHQIDPQARNTILFEAVSETFYDIYRSSSFSAVSCSLSTIGSSCSLTISADFAVRAQNPLALTENSQSITLGPSGAFRVEDPTDWNLAFEEQS